MAKYILPLVMLCLLTGSPGYSQGLIDWLLGGDDKPPAARPVRRKPAYIPKPIPTGKEVYTGIRHDREYLQWKREVYALEYNECGHRDPAWDEDVLAFLDEAALFFDNVYDKKQLKKCRLLLDAIRAKGCKDPYLAYLHGNFLNHEGGTQGFRQAWRPIRSGLAQLEGSSYTKLYWYYAANRLSKMYGKLQWPPAVEELQTKAAGYLAEAATDHMFQGRDGVHMYAESLENIWNSYENKPLRHYWQVLQKLKGVDPYTLSLAKGRFHIKQAWEARGHGRDGHQAAEGGWAKSRREFDRARQALTKAHGLRPDLPYAATHMIGVAMAGGSPGETRKWFDHAVAARVDYQKAYSKYLWSIRPRWGGSHAEMYNFGLECIGTKRFDTDVPHQFLEAVYDIWSEENYEMHGIWQKPSVWPNMKILSEGIINEPIRKHNHHYWRTFYPLAAWACGEYDESLELFKQLPDPPNDEAIGLFRKGLPVIKGEVLAMTGAAKPMLIKAKQLLIAGKTGEALALFKKATGNSENPDTRSFFTERISHLTIRHALDSGQWGSFMPDPAFLNWDRAFGKWEIEADGTLKGTSDEEGLQLFVKNRLHGNAAIRGKIGAYKGDDKYDGGVLLHASYKILYANKGISMRLGGGRPEEVALGQHWTNKLIKKKAPFKEWNDFEFSISNRKATIVFNGKVLFKDIDCTRWWHRNYYGYHIGLLGGYWTGMKPGYVIKYRDLEIRGLPTGRNWDPELPHMKEPEPAHQEKAPEINDETEEIF